MELNSKQKGILTETLCFKPVKTGQVKGVTYAQEYALKTQLGKLAKKD